MLCFLFILLTLGQLYSNGHEPPHFKYSKEANTIEINPPTTPWYSVNPKQLWLESLAAISLISVAPLIILCLIPDLTKRQGLLNVLLAFAAGAMLGDAFLHLIPHALDIDHGSYHSHESQHSHKSQHSHESQHNHGSHNHDHMDSHGNVHDHKRHLIVGLCVVAGIFAFLCIEKCVRLARNSHGHSHQHQSFNNTEIQSKGKNKKNNVTVSGKKEKAIKSKRSNEYKISGYLNLAADFTHNFTDGLAIGGSFIISRNVGIMTTITVLLHELPHELGDYAILIQSGFSARKAMFLQLITAIGAFLGLSFSLVAAGVGIDSVRPIDKDIVTQYILPFTAGGFIYIAMTSVLPDLLSSDESNYGSPSSSKQTRICKVFTQTIFEIVALVSGVGMMVVLGSME